MRAAVIQMTSTDDLAANLRAARELVAQAREGTGAAASESRITEFLLSCANERPYVLCMWDLDRAEEKTRQSIAELAGALAQIEARSMMFVTTAPHANARPRAWASPTASTNRAPSSRSGWVN